MSDKLSLYPGAVGNPNNFNEPWVLIVLCKSKKGEPRLRRRKRWAIRPTRDGTRTGSDAAPKGSSRIPAATTTRSTLASRISQLGQKPSITFCTAFQVKLWPSEASELGQMSWPSQFIAASRTAAEGSLPYSDIQWF